LIDTSSRSQVNKSYEKWLIINHYLRDETGIVGDDRTIPTQAKLAELVIIMAGSGLKSEQRKKVT
jgi:hypothetical protein